MKKGLLRGLLAAILALLVTAGAGGLWVWQFKQSLDEPVTGLSAFTLEVPQGATLAQVSETLYQKGWLFHPPPQPQLAPWEKRTRPHHQGRHPLRPGMTPRDILKNLQSPGEPDLTPVTIPEGFTLAQIAHRLAANGIIGDPARFLELARHPAQLTDTNLRTLPAPSLEGYLYPDTYFFKTGMDEEAVIEHMTGELFRRWEKDDVLSAITGAKDRHRLLTLASIVEREARVAEERPVVAGLYENRLKRGMLLQCDATVQYALPQHKTRVLYSDLEINSPYNTYRFPGLPPGPIASPGLAAIRAAARPASHPWLYMVVVDPSGRHAFAQTTAEHQRNVARFRQMQREGLYR